MNWLLKSEHDGITPTLEAEGGHEGPSKGTAAHQEAQQQLQQHIQESPTDNNTICTVNVCRVWSPAIHTAIN